MLIVLMGKCGVDVMGTLTIFRQYWNQQSQTFFFQLQHMSAIQFSYEPASLPSRFDARQVITLILSININLNINIDINNNINFKLNINFDININCRNGPALSPQ